LEWLHAAPIYDNGSSLWYNQATPKESTLIKCQPFCETHEAQIKLVSDFSWLDLSALKDVDEEINELLVRAPLIDDLRRSAICTALMERVKKFDQLI